MSFSSLIKGITPKILMFGFCPCKQRSFEPFMCLDLTLSLNSTKIDRSLRGHEPRSEKVHTDVHVDAILKTFFES